MRDLEKIRENARARRARYRAKHPERVAAQKARWRAQKPEDPQERQREVARVTRYAKRHPERVATQVARLRALGYFCWSGMLQRCFNPNNNGYQNYGGRDITADERYQQPNGFKNLIADISKRPSLKHSLDRYPNNETGSYVPGNIRWATKKEQANNRRVPRRQKRAA